VPPDPFGKPGARRHRIIEHVLGHETAAALLDADQAIAGKFLQCPPHGVAIDGEALRKLRLGRKPFSWRRDTARDLLLDRPIDLAPQRHAGLAVGARHLSVRQCHGKFIH